MRTLLALLVALAVPAAARGEDSFDYKLTFPDGVPGVMHARVEKSGDKGDKRSVTCEYFVSQEAEMGLPNMPLGSWRGTAEDKVDRDAIRSLCLRHYEDALPPD